MACSQARLLWPQTERLLNMANIQVSFDEKNHKYFDNLGREYISVTQLIHEGRPEFNPLEVAKKVSRISSSKYYNIPVQTILEQWEASAPLGTALHGEVERYINSKVITEDKLFRPCVEQFSKLKFSGKLTSEMLVFDEELLIAGTVDLLEESDPLYLYDIKTSTSNKDGVMAPEKVADYTLQLNLYKLLVEKRLQRPCHIIGILWFKDFARMKENTKLTIIPIKENMNGLYTMLQKRRLQVQYKLR